MPDISLLIELADFYDVSIPEIVNGERKSGKMNEEVKEVAKTLSTYANSEKENLIEKIRNQSIIGVIALLVYYILDISGIYEKYTVLEYLSTYSLTLVFVTPVMILIYTTGVMEKVRKNKKYQGISKLALLVVAFAIAAGTAFLLKTVLVQW